MNASIDEPQFRQVCGHFATGVVVLTVVRPDGTPAGMTANSFASVSLFPPLISLAIDHAADMHQLLIESSHFMINILERRQEAISRRFGGPHPSRFDGIGYRMSVRGLPILDGVLTAIECVRHQIYEAGDHSILVGRAVGSEVHEGKPLLYYRGGYMDSGPA